MKTREFGATGVRVSEVGLGTWQLGGDWGEVDDAMAQATLASAVEAGVTFFDTADVYGAGRSEQRIGRFLRKAGNDLVRVATKFGRGGDPGGEANFTYDVMRTHCERSIERLGVERLWLTQGHCLPRAIIERGEIFDHMRRLQQDGLIEHFGMSVESIEEAKSCLRVDGLASLQVIFNVFRQRLVDELFDEADRNEVALIVRLPLASGVLAGKMTLDRKFTSDDHRNYNRDGQAFNVGETFAGLTFGTAIELAESLQPMVPAGWTMAQWALRYCLDFPAVTTVIAGARSPQQVRDNVEASARPELSASQHAELARFYRERVHAHIRGAY
jgi:aryl-alcohol dehydrogenase-like predicted oxidoreductase